MIFAGWRNSSPAERRAPCPRLSPERAIAGLIFATWIALYGWEIAPVFYRLQGAALLDPDLWLSLCLGPDPKDGAPADFLRSLALWSSMVVAMMLPVAWPYWRTYRQMAESARDSLSARAAGDRAHFPHSGGLFVFIAGYLAIWLGYAAIAAFLESVWTAFDFPAIGGGESRAFAAALFAIAGLYQFSPWKAACLARCRSPMAFFLARWRPGWRGALNLGLAHGRDCLGCCWALMALAFLGGIANHLWMGIATLIMMLEQSPRFGRFVEKPLGLILIGLALGIAIDPDLFAGDPS